MFSEPFISHQCSDVDARSNEDGHGYALEKPEMSYDEHFHKVKLFKFKSQAQVKTFEKI